MPKELVVFPDERLRIQSTPVQEFGSALDEVVQDMTWVMKTLVGNGMGITAVQAGVHQRICLIEVDPKQKPIVICNPEILEQTLPIVKNEGCLSFPGKFYQIKRPTFVWLAYLNKEGQLKKAFFHQYHARCILHEIDHMNGILFTDRAKEQGQQLLEEHQ
jgi:peptide deformylase